MNFYLRSYFLLLWLCGQGALSACAYQYVDEGGFRHVIGFAHVITQHVEGNKEIGIQQVSTFGLSILRLPEAGGISIGYSRNFSIEVFADTAAIVSLDQKDVRTFAYCDIPWRFSDIRNLKRSQSFPLREDGSDCSPFSLHAASRL